MKKGQFEEETLEIRIESTNERYNECKLLYTRIFQMFA